ncbi:MAG: radical SAM protein [Magnetococcales bacterium]|nr:radical SAM protein [Magnetococcales bacterium]
MKKKLLFGFFSETFSFPASILSSLAIEANWECDLVFFDIADTEQEIANKIEQSKPDLVALTLRTFERNQAVRVAQIAHTMGCKVIAGGSHPTVCPDDLGKKPFFDGVVIGDGVGVFQQILSDYQNLSGQQIIGKPHQDLSKYYANRLFTEKQIEEIRKSKMHYILTSMGCPFECTFCASQPYKPFQLQDVINEIIQFVNEYGVERIVIFDDTFGLNLKRVKKFRKLLHEANVSPIFSLQMRASIFSEEFAKEFVAMGVTELGFGLETVSEKLLKFLNKKATVEDAYKSIEICRKYNLFPKINLLFGLPTQDQEDYENTLKFVKEMKPDAIFQHFYVPLPGSELYRYCIDHGYMPDDLSFDNYFGIDPKQKEFKGLLSNSGMLKNIDYDMASYYMNEIKRVTEDRLSPTILAKARIADEKNWILFGAGDYFHRVLEILSRHQWKNFLGYVNSSPAVFKDRVYDIKLDVYEWGRRETIPEIVLTTYHYDKNMKNTASIILSERYDYHGEVRSIATFGNN